MYLTKETADLYQYYRPTCVFVNSKGLDERIEALTVGAVAVPEVEEAVCGKPAVGVYVAADYTKELRPFCAEHLKDSERGDGPVYGLFPVPGGLERRATDGTPRDGC